MNTMKWMATTAFLGAVAAGGGAKADVIYSTYGPSDAYPGIGYAVSGPNSGEGSTWTLGFTFTAAITSHLSEIDVPFDRTTGSGNFNLTLYADDGSHHLGAIIEDIQNIGPAKQFGSTIAVSSVLHPLLTAGTNYWLVASPADPGTWIDWGMSLSSPLVLGYMLKDGVVSYNPQERSTIYRLIGDVAVPEPSSLALCGLGLAAVAGYARRRKARG